MKKSIQLKYTISLKIILGFLLLATLEIKQGFAQVPTEDSVAVESRHIERSNGQNGFVSVIHASELPPVAPDAPMTPTVRRLLAELTVDEKITLSHLIHDPDNSKVGSVGYFPGVPRLGIPTRRDADALGIQVIHPATALPSRIGLGASFDRAAVYAAGQLVGSEGRALGVDLVYAPQADIARLANWGRNNATYGEDPFLTGEMASEEIYGIQSCGLMSQIKHFAFYSGQAGAMYVQPVEPRLPSVIDDQTAHEIYLEAFRKPLIEAQPSSVMASYQGFRITPQQDTAHWATDNPLTLKTILRDRWSYVGFAESDYDATHNVHALLSGLDQDSSPDKNYFADELKLLVDPSSKTYDPDYAHALDIAVARVLYQYERFGLLKSSPLEKQGDCSPNSRPDIRDLRGLHAQITERLAEEATVLLKNEGQALPLTPADLTSVAVIGPTASQVMIDGGQPERARGFPDRTAINTLQMLRRLAPADANFTYATGIDWIGRPIPASSFSEGLVRTQSDSGARTTVADINYDLHTRGNDLTPGVTYTWEGTLNVPANDTYYFWIQRSWLDALFSHRHTTGVTIDGVDHTLVAPGVPVDTYPAGVIPPHGTNEGFPLRLKAGTHRIVVRANVPRIGFYPIDETSPIPITTPVTFRLAWSRLSESMAEAVTIARSARTVVLFVDDNGLPEDETGISTEKVVGSLAPNQDALIDSVTAVNPNTVVVMSTGNPVLTPWIDNVRAVLENWYPGQEGATAIAKLLLGQSNPSGRTPVTWPASADETPFSGHPERVSGNGREVVFSEGMYVGYRWYDQNGVNPRFPFGHGLSYTRFGYSDLVVKPDSTGLSISFNLRNEGKVRGAEVPQVYVGPPDVDESVQVVPQKLVAFDRIELDPGETRNVVLHVSQHDLSYWSTTKQEWVFPGGERDLIVGASSRDIRLRQRVMTN